MFHDNHTQPWGGVVWLVIDAAHSTDRGNVKVDLAQALNQVATLLQSRYGWTNMRRAPTGSNTIQFGVEFGLPNANVYGSGPTPFSLDLTSYCLHLDTTVAAGWALLTSSPAVTACSARWPVTPVAARPAAPAPPLRPGRA